MLFDSENTDEKRTATASPKYIPNNIRLMCISSLDNYRDYSGVYLFKGKQRIVQRMKYYFFRKSELKNVTPK